ncbi:acryloyl-CoA reductase [Paenibacillus sp. J22TS3]|uniref:acrylyl-CoA reductase family protein n=1 Tax=Paenibacillus sp. J22TS3 TaxID=2807192 RepID=UPI001AFF14C6|nr:acryloyl-CoA reductase [Paenibacillus sp. J22TS3]GIP21520.1 alcohol dehydrogenase [Paenibacillus sp. J22TS3]
MQSAFRAFVVARDESGFRAGVEQVGINALPEGDILVRVQYSSVNYKDGLASIPDGKIVQRYPFIPGIDLAGEVIESANGEFSPGDRVLCTGYGLGVSHEGGYAEYARLPAAWLVRLPEGLTAKEAMTIGTAGFTAALSVDRLLRAGLAPENGPVLVTGATGGVGSMAVDILSKLGFEVTASTGKAPQEALLRGLGAAEVISRADLAASAAAGALGRERWAAVVDPVGGPGTGELLKVVRYGGAIAVSGMTGGGKFESTVFPFILRGVQLLGIDSVMCPAQLRQSIWDRLAGEWKPVRALKQAVTEVELEQLPQALEAVLAGRSVGRQVVRIS